MNKRFAIFDMDGTLVDSMVFWRRLAYEFLARRGVKEIPADILEQIKPMTMTESAELFIRSFGISGTPESIVAEMDAMMEAHYRTDVPLKRGMQEYLHRLRDNGVRLCVASATAMPLMRACFARLGVLEYFEFLLSCEDIGIGKTQPDIYYAAARQFGARPEEIAVFEDALYAAKTAKNAGFYVVGVYDEGAAGHWQQLCQLADETIK